MRKDNRLAHWRICNRRCWVYALPNIVYIYALTV